MTDVVVRTLRLRGASATRLARAAARELPAALENALGDLDDIDIDGIDVRLDFDPELVDDATIALLWAEAIRVEVLAAGASTTGRRERLRATREAARRHPSRAVSTVADALAAASAWLAAPPPRGPVPVTALLLAEPTVADRAIAAVGRRRWAALVRELDQALSAPRGPAATSTARAKGPASSPSFPGHTETPEATEVAGRRENLRASASASQRAPEDSADDRARPDRERAAASRVGALTDLVDPDQTKLDLDTVTRAAGLALLYPWLADVCRASTELHPHREESEVRALTLAVVVNPDNTTLVQDPFITLLAGRVETVANDAPPLRHLADVRSACEGALRSFASLMPGFTESSPTFVRQQWVARAGIVDIDRDPALLTAATHPLDVVLTMLPYPVALFALPWTRPIAVRFRP